MTDFWPIVNKVTVVKIENLNILIWHNKTINRERRVEQYNIWATLVTSLIGKRMKESCLRREY